MIDFNISVLLFCNLNSLYFKYRKKLEESANLRWFRNWCQEALGRLRKFKIFVAYCGLLTSLKEIYILIHQETKYYIQVPCKYKESQTRRKKFLKFTSNRELKRIYSIIQLSLSLCISLSPSLSLFPSLSLSFFLSLSFSLSVSLSLARGRLYL